MTPRRSTGAPPARRSTGAPPARRSTGAPPAQRPRLFGTDGIRGAFGRPPLNEATVRGLAAALAGELRENSVLRSRPSGATRPLIVLGGDTRDSTPVLCRWLTEELADRGVESTYLGIVPTPCVAYAARALTAACGIAVSASHNPHPDNGIKLVDGEGFKWPTASELRLEGRLRDGEAVFRQPASGATVDLEPDRVIVEAYRSSLLASLVRNEDPRPLDGLTVALDAGNGAASAFARQLFEQLGARVRIVHDTPDGHNINLGCGSTYPQVVAELVRSTGADLGFSFDGDADRALVADESGEVRDGDAVLYLWGCDLARRGRLPGRRLVATSMSNLGLEVALRREDIGLVRCDVGDREVVETMRRDGIELGGEQSGHIVSLSLSTTGDGLLTALQVAGLKQRDGRPLSAMLEGFERFPQLLKNLPVRHKPDLDSLPKVVEASREVERKLGSEGRLVLRYSGTEPLVRIMIEGPTRERIEALADELAAVLEDELG